MSQRSISLNATATAVAMLWLVKKAFSTHDVDPLKT